MLSKFTFQVLFEFRIKALDFLFNANIYQSLDECDFFPSQTQKYYYAIIITMSIPVEDLDF